MPAKASYDGAVRFFAGGVWHWFFVFDYDLRISGLAGLAGLAGLVLNLFQIKDKIICKIKSC